MKNENLETHMKNMSDYVRNDNFQKQLCLMQAKLIENID